jgi:hypothetical protein
MNRSRLSDQEAEEGQRLLSLFLQDGKIRGIDKTGEIYEQVISPALTAKFVAALQRIPVRGA